MHELRRTVRLNINPGATGEALARPEGPRNGEAGTPPPAGLTRHYAFELACRGQPDPDTGYLVDIKTIDAVVRGALGPILADVCSTDPTRDPASLMPALWRAASEDLRVRQHGAGLVGLRWDLTPYHAVEMSADAPRTVVLRERFDFAAAHRLHVPDLSDEENRRLFGKCNNPSGHGHNYRIEPAVAVDLDRAAEAPFSHADLERLTAETVIDPFDHTHLNLDTPEFDPVEGVNPSVENMARVFFERLSPAIASASAAATLRSVTVWETDRTCCTYPAI